MAFGELIYYLVRSEYRTGPANVFIVESWLGPVRAVRLDHPSKSWVWDPMTVHLTLMDDMDQEESLVTQLNRTQAEEVAVLLGSDLPSEDRLRHMMQDGVDNQTD